MPKPTKPETTKYRAILVQRLLTLTGDVGAMREEALRASDQDNSVDHLADQGTDNADQAFTLGLIENEEETIGLIRQALDRMEEDSRVPFGACLRCSEEVEEKARKKSEIWIPKPRLEYLPWACYCIQHQEEIEKSRESA
jgi:RNA polymerase-binding transcription factor DksA